VKHDEGLLILRGMEVRAALAGKEKQVIAAVKDAYCEHQAGNSCLPHSVFVRFPGREKERIIALPGFLGGKDEIAGIKWISSFPQNVAQGISRASAIMVLNSLATGRPEALLEGSIISAARTAASAALAADVMHARGGIDALGVIGCGLIAKEIVRYVAALGRKLGTVLVYDIDAARAAAFRDSLAPIVGAVPVEVCASTEEVLRRGAVIAFATTAVTPTVADISICRPGATILHISLRDLTAQAILQGDNIVDDVDHVMRAQTSVHLAEQQVGHRNFVRGTLADVVLGKQPPRRDERTVAVFSPFGLGVLDLAVARLVMADARQQGKGTRIDGFFDGT
jgi:ornithine cyclodeaminase